MKPHEEFYDAATIATIAVQRGLHHEWKSALDATGHGQVVPLKTDHLIEGDVLGVLIRVKGDWTRARSGWMYQHVSQVAGPTTRIGVAGRGAFMQFSQFAVDDVREALYVVASGESAVSALEAAISADSTFDPSSFDSDGYLKVK